MAATAQDQTAMDEKVVDDRDLEKMLEDRERAKAGKSEATSTFRTKDEVVKQKIGEFNLAVGEVARVGRFRIEHKPTAPRDVSFEVPAGSRVAIKVDDEG